MLYQTTNQRRPQIHHPKQCRLETSNPQNLPNIEILETTLQLSTQRHHPSYVTSKQQTIINELTSTEVYQGDYHRPVNQQYKIALQKLIEYWKAANNLRDQHLEQKLDKATHTDDMLKKNPSQQYTTQKEKTNATKPYKS